MSHDPTHPRPSPLSQVLRTPRLVFSDVNRDLRPEQIARIITSAGLEQARLEAEAQAEDTARAAGLPRKVREAGDD